MTKATLIRLEDGRDGERCAVGVDPIMLGRAKQSAIRFGDPSMNREHVEIRFADGKHYVRDLGSIHGTTINGQKLLGEHLLRDGDVIGMGASLARYASSGAEADVAPPVARARSVGAPSWEGDLASPGPALRVETHGSRLLRMSSYHTEQQIAVMTSIASAADALPPGELQDLVMLRTEGLCATGLDEANPPQLISSRDQLIWQPASRGTSSRALPVREVRILFLDPAAAIAHGPALARAGASAWFIDEATGVHRRASA